VDFYNHPGGSHGFDLVTAEDARAAYIVRATLHFFHEHLGNRQDRNPA
jgi:hypothetical protein